MVVAISRSLGPIPVDVVLQEEHHARLTITRNPVEFGADVTDHAYVEPKELRLWGIIGPTSGRAGIVNGQPATRVSSGYQEIVALQESREPFDIVTGLDLYEDMLIEAVDVTRHKDNAGVLEFYAHCRQVIIVEGTHSAAASGPRAAIRIADPETALRAATSVNRGQVSGVPVSLAGDTLESLQTQTFLERLLTGALQ